MTELAFEFLPPSRAERPYSVSEINGGIAVILESANSLVWVEGEISNFRVTSSGHCYLRLKDSESQIPSVLWRQTAAKIPFTPEEGMAVLVIASIRVYQKGGYYQLDIHRMEPRGKGALFAAFEQLKKKLAAEGLFDPEHKIPLPASIRRLGVVTSKQGAVIRDIIRVVASRSPQTDIVLVDVPVQGETAAPKIAAALRDLDACGKVDCIIVGRGGGSVEDLWPFNEEVVARAIHSCATPVISAVGHEIDFTIADFAADVRAPTPSAAAEIATPDRRESRKFFDACASRFAGAVCRHLVDTRNRFESCLASRSLRSPLQRIVEGRQELDDHTHALNRRVGESVRNAMNRFSSAASRLNALSPLAVLSRGYSAITTAEGQTVRSSEQVSPGQNVSMRFHKGSADATVTRIAPIPLTYETA